MYHHSKKNTPALILGILLMLLCGHTLRAQQDHVIAFNVGSFIITLLPEGQGQGNTGILVGATEEMLKKTVPDGTFPNATNAFLVEAEGKTILFDTGYGRELFENMKVAGKTPADISAVILTHMHGDHIGGLLINGKKAFPTATLYIPQPEYDYWMSDEAMLKVPENRRGNFTSARNIFSIYKDKLQLFAPGEIDGTQELIPGIRSIAAYGHTPGHTGYMLSSEDAKLFIWGDLTHAMAIQMPYPEVAVTYDVNPAQAIEYRRKLLQYIAENKIRIAGMHIQYPGIGDVKKNESAGYDFTLICACEGRY